MSDPTAALPALLAQWRERAERWKARQSFIDVPPEEYLALCDAVEALQKIKADIVPEYLRDHPGSYRALNMLDAALSRLVALGQEQS